MRQVEQCEQHDPDEIDHMPEARTTFEKGELSFTQAGPSGESEHRDQDAQTHQKVECMQTGEHKEVHEEVVAGGHMPVGNEVGPLKNLVEQELRATYECDSDRHLCDAAYLGADRLNGRG